MERWQTFPLYYTRKRATSGIGRQIFGFAILQSAAAKKVAVPGPKSSLWELTGASRADFAIRCNNTNGEVPIFYRRDELVARIRVGSWENSPYRMEEWKPNRPDSLKDMLSEIVPEANKFSVKLGFDYINNDETRWDPCSPCDHCIQPGTRMDSG